MGCFSRLSVRESRSSTPANITDPFTHASNPSLPWYHQLTSSRRLCSHWLQRRSKSYASSGSPLKLKQPSYSKRSTILMKFNQRYVCCSLVFWVLQPWRWHHPVTKYPSLHWPILLRPCHCRPSWTTSRQSSAKDSSSKVGNSSTPICTLGF